ncbi:hypothetical protein ACWGLF_45790 [Streptomyces puniciscabiei]
MSFFEQDLLDLVHLPGANEALQQVRGRGSLSTAAAGRYVTEVVDVLADHAPTLLDAQPRISDCA